MDRRSVPRRLRALVVVACLAAALLLTATSASGKKPPWAGSSRSPHGQRAQQAPEHATAPLVATSTETESVAPSKAALKRGNGNGNGHGRGRKTASSAGATAAPAAFTPGAAAAPGQASRPTGGTAARGSSSHASKSRRGRSRGGRAGGTRHRATVRGGAASAPQAGPPAATTRAVQPPVHARPRHTAPHHSRPTSSSAPATVIRTLDRVVRVVPPALKILVVVLSFLVLVGTVAYFLLARTTRYLARQRKALLGEIGVLQAALLPDVPDEIGGLRPSVAYRPADGPAAGGDFYDAFPLDDGRVGIVIGDISGHGRDALMRTSLLRHTLRAYLDAGLEPRAALQVGGRVLEREAEEIATVIVATYDPAGQLLRYSSAGHPPPVFLGPADHVPVTRASSPPIGAGMPTGLRQTTVSVPDGSTICLFTDGLIEARREGRMIGRLGLVRIISELGREMSAQSLLDRVAAQADGVFDDMAACLFRVEGRAAVDVVRIEELEVRREDLGRTVVDGFLAGCGVEHDEAERLAPLVRETVERFGRALVRIAIAREAVSCEVLPANVESLAAASSRRGVA